VAAKLSDDERQRIIELCEQGKSCRDIAAETGRSKSTVAALANEIGHRFGQSNASRAHEARSAYSAERRAEIAARATVEAELLLDQLHGEYLVFNFGGRDNTYEEHTLTGPPVEAKLNLMRAFQLAMRTVLDIDKHDNREEHGESKGLLVRIVESVRAGDDG
jgi:transposase-like protein